MYTQKGGKLDIEEEGETPFEVETVFNVDYLEVPVTLAYTLSTGRLVPTVYAGPYVGLAVRRNFSMDFGPGDISVDADDVFKTADYGAVFGIDLGFPMLRRVATVGVRYDLGLADIVKDEEVDTDDDVTVSGTDVRNGDLSVMVGFRF